MLITDEYKQLNTQLHHTSGGYGSKGKAWAPRVIKFAGKIKAKTILDYGCGKGSLKREIEAFDARVRVEDEPGFEVREYDPAIPGKDAPPERADLVVCTDVLEHVEPDCIDAVIADLVRLAGKAVLVAVACRPGKRILADGRTDHLTVEPPAWWARRFAKFGPWDEIPALRDKEYTAVLRK